MHCSLRMQCAFRLLPEKLQYSLRHLICLSQHSLCCLLQDAVLGEFHHFFSHIYIADTAFSSCQVFCRSTQVVDSVFKAVLVGTKPCPFSRYFLIACYGVIAFSLSAVERQPHNTEGSFLISLLKHGVCLICTNVQFKPPLFNCSVVSVSLNAFKVQTVSLSHRRIELFYIHFSSVR